MTGRYETIVVGAPTLTDDEFTGIVSALESAITDGKGSLIRTEPWGKRKLAYRIEKFEEGHYSLLFYESAPNVVVELERRIRMNERLIRFLTVKVDWEEKVAKAAALKAARRTSAPGTGADDVESPDLDALEAGEEEGGRA